MKQLSCSSEMMDLSDMNEAFHLVHEIEEPSSPDPARSATSSTRSKSSSMRRKFSVKLGRRLSLGLTGSKSRPRSTSSGRGGHGRESGEPLEKSRWKVAIKKVLNAQRFAREDFNRARRSSAISKEDPPGHYKFEIAHASGVKVVNAALLKLIAGEKGSVFEISHETIDTHAFSWSTTITDPNGNVLPPGTMFLKRFPFVRFDDADCSAQGVEPARSGSTRSGYCRPAVLEPRRVIAAVQSRSLPPRRGRPLGQQ